MMATIGKKFTSPGKYEAAWYLRFPSRYRLTWNYMWDRCDHAGVIEFVPAIWSVHLGETITMEDLDELIKLANQDKERIVKLDGGKIWLTEYIRFQQKPDQSEPLSGTHGFTKTIVRLVKDHGLYELVKKRDPILFSAYESETSNSEASKPSTSLTNGSTKGLSKSSSKSGGEGSSGSPPLANPKKNEEPLFTVAERVLTVWPSGSSDVMFAETNAVEEILKDAQEKGVPVCDAETKLRAYLKGEKIKLMETEEDRDLMDILDDFELKTKT